MTTSLRRCCTLAALALIASYIVLGAAPAMAHMGVASSNPANGSQIALAPDEVTITFTMEVELDTAVARLRHLGGVDTPVSEITNNEVLTEALEKKAGQGQGDTATFDLPELPAGLYAIDWSVQEVGGHINSSPILFKVTEGVGGGTPVPFLVVGVVLALGVAAGIIVERRKK